MFSTTLKYMIIGTASVGFMAACSTPNSAAVFTSGQAQSAQTVQLGTVISVNNVQIQGDNNQLVTAAGTAIGGLAGSRVSSRSVPSAIGAVAGATAAGVGTQAVQQRARPGFEITVQQDNGSVISIVQAADVPMGVGMRVRVVSGGGSVRVLPL